MKMYILRSELNDFVLDSARVNEHFLYPTLESNALSSHMGPFTHVRGENIDFECMIKSLG